MEVLTELCGYPLRHGRAATFVIPCTALECDQYAIADEVVHLLCCPTRPEAALGEVGSHGHDKSSQAAHEELTGRFPRTHVTAELPSDPGRAAGGGELRLGVETEAVGVSEHRLVGVAETYLRHSDVTSHEGCHALAVGLRVM
jgi:hypothetical protein